MIPSSYSSSSPSASTSSSRNTSHHPRITDSTTIPRITGDVVGSVGNGNGAASIRPRNRRLVSTEQELVSTRSGAGAGAGAGTPSGSRSGSASRNVSPIPQKHPSRGLGGGSAENGAAKGGVGGAAGVRERGKGSGRPVGGLLAPDSEGEGGRGGRASPISIGGFWDGGWMSSWSTLQGMASAVLGGTDDGGDASASTSNGGRGGFLGGGSTNSKGKAWGPEALPKQHDGGIGQGSVAERDAIVRRKKVTRVLEGREEVPTIRDTNGNYKRRTSQEEQRPGSSQQDDDALVYIHHVQPNDTLAGVVLRYNCQPAVFRKANRFWPNDSIQIRKTVILPVDACTIKGRPCDPPLPGQSGVDLLAPTPKFEDPPDLSNGSWPSSSQTQTSAERSDEEENPWIHVRWVLIDSSPHSKPVEIARMPRKTLGYFPPRRRKSHAALSSASTPRASSEFPRLSSSISQTSTDAIRSEVSTPPRRLSNLGPQPSYTSTPGSYFPPPPMSSSPRPRSSRRENTGEAADRLNWMRGPGGVGTLGKNVRTPGPGKDGMNSWVTKHLPGIAIDSLPSSSIQASETAHFGFSDELASIAEGPSFNNPSNNATGPDTPMLGPNGLGLENAAAAIEGWVRRMAVKGPGTPKGGGRSEAPDLIELLDGTGSDDGRGFELSPGSTRIAAVPSGRGGREDLESIVRGRLSAGAKGGKSD